MSIDPDTARALAGSLAETLRGQAELGVEDVDVPRAQRLVRSLRKLIDGVPSAPAKPAPAAAAPAAAPAEAAPRRARSVAEAEAPARGSAQERRDTRAPRATRNAPPSSGAMPWTRRDQAGRRLGVGSDALRAIRDEIGDCTRCPLHERRSNLVFGVGNPNARLMFIGEAPGAEEDRKGEPFVGKAGQLLTKMIHAMTLRREDVYIANVVKCRPPGNRDPKPDEIATCRGYLDKQIDAVAPELIVCLGRVAPSALLGRDVRITKERGTWHEYRGVPVLLTLHPAYLLREPTAKRDAWGDLQQVMKRLGLERRSS